MGINRLGITHNWSKHTGQLKKDGFGTLENRPPASSMQFTVRCWSYNPVGQLSQALLVQLNTSPFHSLQLISPIPSTF